ncbi:MAG: hypothetical protein ACRDYV_04490, partial [Acidimicrobiia bacterium]
MQRQPIPHRTALLRGLGAAACSLLVLAGCGGGAKSEATNLATIDEQIGIDEEGILERQVQAENKIRDCMQAEGFEYVPVDPGAQQAAMVGRSGMSSEEFEKQFGYGITTLYEQRFTQTVAGPNQEIRAALGETERAAYDRALYGDDPTATFQLALDNGDFTRLGGCTKQATAEIFGGTAVIQTLQTLLDDVDEKIFSDSRMVKAVEKWSACMDDAGFDVSEPDEVDAILEQKLEDIVGPPDERVAPVAGQDPPYDGAALRALQQEEVDMVAADVVCEKEHLAVIEEKVAAEYEAEFREENAD